MPEHAPSPTATLLDVKAVAELIGCSPRTVYRLADAGRMPPPVKLGALVRWSKPVLEDWCAQGCPSCAVPGNCDRKGRGNA